MAPEWLSGRASSWLARHSAQIVQRQNAFLVRKRSRVQFPLWAQNRRDERGKDEIMVSGEARSRSA